MFDELHDKHGSVQGYFDTLGVDATLINRMRDELLE
jgi:hypothetical protein